MKVFIEEIKSEVREILGMLTVEEIVTNTSLINQTENLFHLMNKETLGERA